MLNLFFVCQFIEWESKVKKAEEFLERVGDNDAIIPLYEKCFEREVGYRTIFYWALFVCALAC